MYQILHMGLGVCYERYSEVYITDNDNIYLH